MNLVSLIAVVLLACLGTACASKPKSVSDLQRMSESELIQLVNNHEEMVAKERIATVIHEEKGCDDSGSIQENISTDCIAVTWTVNTGMQGQGWALKLPSQHFTRGEQVLLVDLRLSERRVQIALPYKVRTP